MTDRFPISISWKDEFLSLHSQELPIPVEIHYMEAYCRAGSTHRPWRETVIPHTSRLVSMAKDGSSLELRSDLADGVVVQHRIAAAPGEVTFLLRAHNPTNKSSALHWGQPCVRVGPFAGYSQGNDIEDYLGKCFVFIDGKPERLPLNIWATDGLMTPGQTWRNPSVSEEDVNVRPLSPLLPSAGLIGCVSADETMLIAVAWEPYQELFQGIFRCVHADFRIGGLEPGETKTASGKLYWMENDPKRLLKRFTVEFGEAKG